MQNNKRMCFDVDASKITLKKLLKKEFLELQMKVISSADPNNNKSHFTEEGMKASLESFKNKPILGYFEHGDFVSHNGEWKEDEETKMSYWDTLGQKGERILGLIRSEDEVKVVKEEDGLSWIVLTCTLWVQYNFRQVKRLIKDAQRAQQNGGPTKNVSVEVEFTDWTERADGVIDINKFNLVGITILGSRNGVKVQPGIEGAELALRDIEGGNELFNSQKKALRMAYEKLDAMSETSKEDYQMDIENKNLATAPAADASKADPANAGATVTTDASATNTDTAMLAKKDEDGDKKDDKKDGKDTKKEAEACGKSNNSEDDKKKDDKKKDDDDKDDDKKDDDDKKKEQEAKKDGVCEKCGKNPCECETKKEKEEAEPAKMDCGCDEQPKTPAPNSVADLASLVSSSAWDIERYVCVIKHYEDHKDLPYAEVIIAFLQKLTKQVLQNQKDASELLAKVIDNKFSDADKDYYTKDQYAELNAKFDALNKEHEELKKKLEESEAKLKDTGDKLAKYQKEEFLAAAKATIDEANFEKEVADKFYKDCEDGKYADTDSLRKEVALAAFNKNKVEQTNFNMPVNSPKMDTEGVAETSKAKSNWEKLDEYIGK